MAGIGPEGAAIKLTATEEETISTMSSIEDIKDYLASLSVEKGLATRDYYSPRVLLPVEGATAAPQKHAKSVSVNGRKHILEADNELALAEAEAALYRAAIAEPTTQPTTAKVSTEQPRDTTTGRFTAAQDAEAKAALDLKFRNGDLSASDYIEQSGAVSSYLKEQGIDPDALREVSARQYEKSWAQATEEFLHSPAGADWPGGQRNLEIIGEILLQNNLTDETNKTAVLASAVKFAREHDLLVQNPETELAQKIASATSHSELAAVLGVPARQKARAEAQTKATAGGFWR